MRDPVGQVVGGKYRVVRRLGGGGVAEVYEAVHRQIGRRLALKVLKREYADNSNVVERLLQEARAASAIGHPGIVQVFDLGRMETGEPFLAMELLAGEDLADVLRRKGKLPAPQAIGVCLHVLDALAAAHAAGVVHRDLKPENVVLVRGPDGQPWAKVIDFGIAHVAREEAAARRSTDHGVIMGIPYYVSPEQARGIPDIDGRADVYAVGVMLFELITGRLPFDGRSVDAIIHRVLHEPFPRIRNIDPSLPEELERVILRATARRREDRYPGAEPFCADLRALSGLPGAATVADAPPPSPEEDNDQSSVRRLRDLAAAPPPSAGHPLASSDRIPSSAPSPGRTSGASLAPRPVPLSVGASAPPPRPLGRSGLTRTGRLFLAGALAGLVVAVTTVVLTVFLPPGSRPAAVAPEPPEPPGPRRTPLIPPLPPPAPDPTIDAATPAAEARDEADVSDEAEGEPARARITLLDVPIGASATLDGEPVGPAFELPADGRPRALEVTLRGRRPFRRTIEPTADLEIPVVLERARGPATGDRPPDAPDAGTVRDAPRLLSNPFEEE
jgi:serine/threonine-protein kinase